MRELFVYYRIRVTDASAARIAVAQLQSGLRLKFPGLIARLLHRPETCDGEQTWMEVYTIDPARAAGGVDPMLQAAIETEAEALLNRWLVGVRHAEVFVASAS